MRGRGGMCRDGCQEGVRGYVLGVKFNDEYFLIRGIWVVCEVLFWIRGFFQGNIFNKAEFLHFLRFDQVRQNVIPGIIQIGIDFVGGKVPGFPGEFDSDVAADGAKPHGLPWKRRVCTRD